MRSVENKSLQNGKLNNDISPNKGDFCLIG